MKEGWTMHNHHNILVDWCYDYNTRVENIENHKPKEEIKTRLKLFKFLPKEAIKEIPSNCRTANRKCQEASQKCEEAYQEYLKTPLRRQKAYQETFQKYRETYQKYQEVRQEYEKAYKKAYREWSQKDKNAFHKKWCNCQEWNGKEIVFFKGGEK